MTRKSEALDSARAEAKRARLALKSRLGTVKDRLRPGSLAQDMKDAARDRAIQAASAMLATRHGRPVVAAGAVVAGTAYLLRKPIARLVTRTLGKAPKFSKGQDHE